MVRVRECELNASKRSRDLSVENLVQYVVKRLSRNLVGMKEIASEAFRGRDNDSVAVIHEIFAARANEPDTVTFVV